MTDHKSQQCACVESLENGEGIPVDVIDGGETDNGYWSEWECPEGHTNIYSGLSFKPFDQ